jgi:nitrogenase iron protein
LKGIAFYGKGGIGKSTTISNVIAALSMKNKKILQIGCDPKHDSTRLLLGGFTQITVLEQLTTKGVVSLDTVMLTGYNQVKCIESGGPEPGVGCAGRGIIQTLQLLKDQGLDMKQFDYVFFDVLGDVVCGGFAVPMREGYADEVYIVSSGEIASLYAANNIAKGLQRFTSTHGKLGGIIGNLRGINNERKILEAFAKKIGTEIVAFIPRSDLLPQAELASKTIMEFAPNTDLANVYLAIADYIEHQFVPVIPTPLSETELEEFLYEFCYGAQIKEKPLQPLQVSVNNNQKQLVSQNTVNCKNGVINSNNLKVSSSKERVPLYGCSLTGAYSVVNQISDATALMDSPQGCAYINYCTHQNALSNSLDVSSFPNLLCTNMQASDVIFGGTKNIEETLIYMKKRFPAQPIFLITSCPAGLIGDDIASLISKLSTKNQKLFHLPSDGVMGGDFYSGMLAACKLIANEFIDKTITPTNDIINLIGEQSLATTADSNFQTIKQILTALSIKINCRFIRQTSIEEIKNFRKAKVNLLVTNGPTVNELAVFLDEHFGTETLQLPLPIGFNQTVEFIRAIAHRFDKVDLAEKFIATVQIAYKKELEQLKPCFAGKKVLINSNGANVDWLQYTLMDLDVEVKQISAFNIFHPEERALPKSETNYTADYLEEVVRLSCPDFILSALPLIAAESVRTLTATRIPCIAFPVLPPYGFNSGLAYVKELYFKLQIPFIEGWRYDE